MKTRSHVAISILNFAVCRESWLVASAHPSVVLNVPGNCQTNSTQDLNSLKPNVKIRLEKFWSKVAELPRLSVFRIYDIGSSRLLAS